MTGAIPPPRLPGPSREPWVETRVGGWVFVHGLLAAPALVVAVPLLVRALLRTLGVLSGPSVFLDTIPMVAGFVVPWVGWGSAVLLALVLRTLAMAPGPRARWALWGFVMVHLAVLGYTVWWWAFSRTFPEPPFP